MGIFVCNFDILEVGEGVENFDVIMEYRMKYCFIFFFKRRKGMYKDIFC